MTQYDGGNKMKYRLNPGEPLTNRLRGGVSFSADVLRTNAAG
jgi:hypothetical protein